MDDEGRTWANVIRRPISVAETSKSRYVVGNIF